jgi:serine/threonine-protein kinase
LESRKLVEVLRPRHFFWSPDGEWAGYIAENKLWKVPAAGGPPQVISQVPTTLGSGCGATWTKEDEIVLAPATSGNGLFQVSAQGGDLVEVLKTQPGVSQDFHDPALLPDGKGILYVIDRSQGVIDTIALFSSQVTKEVFRIDHEVLNSPVYSPTGHIVFRRQTTNPGIWAVPFSLSKLEVTGPMFLIAPNGSLPSVSQEGTLTYVQTDTGGLQQLVWLDRSGKVIAPLGEPQRGIRWPRLSPDGKYISLTAERDLWVYDLARNTRSRLTFSEKDEEGNWTWTADSKEIVYFALGPDGEETLFAKRADGIGEARAVAKARAGSISADGRFLMMVRTAARASGDLWLLPLIGKQDAIEFLATPHGEWSPDLSPDGRYVAYMSNETGTFRVYVKPVPTGDGKWQASSEAGSNPRWNRKGDKLYYQDANRGLYEVDVTTQPNFSPGTPKHLFTPEASLATGPSYEVSHDSKRFLFVQDLRRLGRTPAITVVQNWFAEFSAQHKK